MNENSSAKDNLASLINKLKEKTGTPDEQLEREIALSKFIASFDKTRRVICKGEWRDHEKHRPAVLIYDNVHKQPRVYIALEKNEMKMSLFIQNFYSTIPHEAIAREAFSPKNSFTI